MRVLVDGPTVSRATEIFNTATTSYAPLGVTLRAVSYETVSFTGDDAQGLIDQAKARFGGIRPADADLVYVFTDKDIQAGGNTAVAGLADCIGGVRFANRAFAVGEDFGPSRTGRPPGSATAPPRCSPTSSATSWAPTTTTPTASRAT